MLPTRSRMGDDTPGHKADPNKRGALRRSKPDGLMYLALQSLQEEERQTGTSGGGSVGGGLQSGYARQAVLGLGEGALLEDGSGILEGLGGGGKMMHMRKRGNKPNSRLLDRKNALSLRLKVGACECVGSQMYGCPGALDMHDGRSLYAQQCVTDHTN